MVLGKPNTKCEHGVFKAGEAVARYCSFCNPAMQVAPIKGWVAPKVEEVQLEEETVDCVTFMELNHASPFIVTR